MNHKSVLVAVFFLFCSSLNSFSQEVQLPEDYRAFLASHENQSFDYFFGIDTWTFWDEKTVLEKSNEYAKKGWVEAGDIVIAINADEQILYYPSKFIQYKHIYLIGDDLEPLFFAMGSCQFERFEKRKALVQELESKDFLKQDLSEITDCPGSMFQYAFELNTSEYDDNFSEERNAAARTIFKKLAMDGHPEAANELADYHYFQEEVNSELLIYWRERAIELGSKEDAYELADYIIDERPGQIDKAIAALESLLDSKQYRGRAGLKLARLYMRGNEEVQDFAKGFALTQKLSDEDNYNAMADLAFYHYQGMGTSKDVKKALELLRKANDLARKDKGRGNWGDFIKKLEQELGENE